MFRNTAEQPLLLNDESSTGAGFQNQGIRLYEPSVMMEMKASIAQGYLTLLTGGRDEKSGSRKVADEETKALAFAALSSGNVIDVCFGATNNGQPSFAGTLSKECKDAIDKATLSDERLEQVAVEAYKDAFRTVVEMNKKLSKLNIFTACFCTRGIRSKAEVGLENSFSPLEQAIQRTQ